MKKRISEQVVVITGASSGIGRETALQLARRGAKVIAVARNQTALQVLEGSAASAEGEIQAVVADVSDPKQVEQIAKSTVDRFGSIDTWVNNAAVSMYATVAESDVEEMERIIAVNLLGQIHGIKAALPYMRAQGGGTIINVSSALGWRGVPYQAAYVASKHGIKGFTETLRLELKNERSNIDVTLILPSSINTPLFEHARSKLGVKPRPIPPVYQPSLVARAILSAAERPPRDLVVGWGGKALILAERISPRLTDWYMLQNNRMFRKQKTNQPDDNQDNLFEPVGGPGAIHGSFGAEAKTRSLYTRLFEQNAWLMAASEIITAILAVPLIIGTSLVLAVVDLASRISGVDVGALLANVVRAIRGRQMST